MSSGSSDTGNPKSAILSFVESRIWPLHLRWCVDDSESFFEASVHGPYAETAAFKAPATMYLVTQPPQQYKFADQSLRECVAHATGR